ncbi:MAG: nitroreductase [Burkholderiales bacterium]|nr:nitroreductase [Burkholderiales bacterium]
MDVSEAVRRRHSVRAFLPDPVDPALVREILETAARSPSGGNLQPWLVYVLAGAPLAEFKATVRTRFEAGAVEKPEYAVYPPRLWEPLRARRGRAAAQRYAAFGQGEGDEAQRLLQLRNYAFFDAPVGLFVCFDRRVGPPQWADLGMFMQTVMLLAVERGLGTCPQEIWANWPRTIASFLDLPETHTVFAGMSLGYADTAAPINGFRTEREPLENFVRMLGSAMPDGAKLDA